MRIRFVCSLSGMVSAVTFSPDGTRVATASYDDTARIWDAGGAPVAQLAHPDWVSDVAFAPDGATVATASYDGVARAWHIGGAP